RYKRPLWLIFVPASLEIELPTPREAQAIYDERFSVEHSIRFMKGDLGLTLGNSTALKLKGAFKSGLRWLRRPFGFCGPCARWQRPNARSFLAGGVAVN